LTALSETEQCDGAKATACFDDLIGKACEVSESTAPCEAIQTTCTDGPVAVADCKKVADLVNPETYGDLTGCMDPAEEGVWDELFVGDCSERLIACARHPFF
jgi:hypothetical protein